MNDGCEYGVQKFAGMMEPYFAPCGDYAVAEWKWIDGSSLRVCSEHDEILNEEENKRNGAERMEVLDVEKCEHCGGSDFNSPCGRCGAPQCCDPCCRETTATELAWRDASKHCRRKARKLVERWEERAEEIDGFVYDGEKMMLQRCAKELRVWFGVEENTMADTLEIDKVLCEVNGKVVLARLNNGELHAPFDLEGIAHYFETRGTPEDLHRPTEHVGYRFRGPNEKEWHWYAETDWDDMDILLNKGWQVEPVYVEVGS